MGILCLVLAGVVRPPLVAFTARIYYPPGDRRLSLHQVYVCNLDGTHRRQITFNQADHEFVRWIGDHKLAWIEFALGREDDVGYRGDDSKPSKLVLFDLPTSRRRVVSTGSWTVASFPGWSESTTWKRGEGIFSRNEQPYMFAGEHLRRFTPPDETETTWTRPGQPAISYAGEDGPVVRTPIDSVGSYEEGPSPVFIRSGKSHAFPIGGELVRLLPSSSPNYSYVLTGSYAGSGGSHEWIYRMDWRSDSAGLVVNDLLDIDFQPGVRYYAGVTWNKATRSLGKIQLWARDIVVGDAQTGKHWIVCGGPGHVVHGSSVSIQPE